VLPAVGDAVGQSLGNALALASVATVREVLGKGTWFDIPVMPLTSGDYGWSVMILPPGAFLTLGLLLGLNVHIQGVQARRKRATEGAPADSAPATAS